MIWPMPVRCRACSAESAPMVANIAASESPRLMPTRLAASSDRRSRSGCRPSPRRSSRSPRRRRTARSGRTRSPVPGSDRGSTARERRSRVPIARASRAAGSRPRCRHAPPGAGRWPGRGRPHVERHRLLVAGDDRPPQRLTLGLDPAPLGHGISAARVLDLDHLGPEITQQLTAEGTGQELTQLDDPHTGQRTGGLRLRGAASTAIRTYDPDSACTPAVAMA